jgi:hypothetical protein
MNLRNLVCMLIAVAGGPASLANAQNAVEHVTAFSNSQETSLEYATGYWIKLSNGACRLVTVGHVLPFGISNLRRSSGQTLKVERWNIPMTTDLDELDYAISEPVYNGCVGYSIQNLGAYIQNYQTLVASMVQPIRSNLKTFIFGDGAVTEYQLALESVTRTTLRLRLVSSGRINSGSSGSPVFWNQVLVGHIIGTSGDDKSITVLRLDSIPANELRALTSDLVQPPTQIASSITNGLDRSKRIAIEIMYCTNFASEYSKQVATQARNNLIRFSSGNELLSGYRLQVLEPRGVDASRMTYPPTALRNEANVRINEEIPQELELGPALRDHLLRSGVYSPIDVVSVGTYTRSISMYFCF